MNGFFSPTEKSDVMDEGFVAHTNAARAFSMLISNSANPDFASVTKDFFAAGFSASISTLHFAFDAVTAVLLESARLSQVEKTTLAQVTGPSTDSVLVPCRFVAGVGVHDVAAMKLVTTDLASVSSSSSSSCSSSSFVLQTSFNTDSLGDYSSHNPLIASSDSCFAIADIPLPLGPTAG
jgi:hypothetical protein